MPRDPFRNFNTYKIDPLSEIRNAGIVTNGQIYWVSAVTDSAHTTRRNDLGRAVVKENIQAAIDAATNDANDYVMVIPQDLNAVYTIGTAIDVNKNRVHLIGVGYNNVAENYAVTIRGFASTTVDTEMVNVIAGGVEIAGLRVLGTLGTNANGTVSNGFVNIGTASTGTGHDLWMHDSTIESGVSVAFGTPALVATPGTVHSARFDNVSFLVPNDTLEKAHAGLISLGAGGKRWKFNKCYFQVFAGSTADRFVTTGTGAKETVLFNDCVFAQTGTVAMASALVGSVTVGNPILMRQCTYFGTITQAGTDPSVFKSPVASGTSAAVRDYGIGVGTAALVPV